MKRSTLFILLVFIFLNNNFVQSQAASSISSSAASSGTSEFFDMTGFPQWARDLRRIEIITFGSFPFVYFVTNFAVDIYRSGQNGWDRRYAPWPFDAAGSVGKNQNERYMTLGLAAGGAVLFAFIDYAIVLYKRSQKEKEQKKLAPGTPIIIQKPLNGEDDKTNPPDNVPLDNYPSDQQPADVPVSQSAATD